MFHPNGSIRLSGHELTQVAEFLRVSALMKALNTLWKIVRIRSLRLPRNERPLGGEQLMLQYANLTCDGGCLGGVRTFRVRLVPTIVCVLLDKVAKYLCKYRLFLIRARSSVG